MDNAEIMDKLITVRWLSSDYWPDNDERPVLCVSANGKMMTFKSIRGYGDWMWKIDKYNIEWWCFQDEIAPQHILNDNDY